MSYDPQQRILLLRLSTLQLGSSRLTCWEWSSAFLVASSSFLSTSMTFSCWAAGGEEEGAEAELKSLMVMLCVSWGRGDHWRTSSGA